jgi:uroporphyrinogen-III synthase
MSRWHEDQDMNETKLLAVGENSARNLNDHLNIIGKPQGTASRMYESFQAFQDILFCMPRLHSPQALNEQLAANIRLQRSNLFTT